MEHTNMYYDMNENPNIFPPSKSYRPQTQIRGDPNLVQMNQRFRDMAMQQQNDQNQYLLNQGNSTNLANSSFVGSRALRAQLSQPKPGSMSYAEIESNGDYQDTGDPVYSNTVTPGYTDNNASYNDNVSILGGTDPRLQNTDPHFQGTDPYQNPGLPGGAVDNSILQVNDLAQKAHAHQAYPHVFMPQPFFQLPQKNLIVDPDPNYLSVDSHDRDRTKFPNPNEYTIPLISSDASGQGSVPGRRYKNIVSIELVSAVIPNRANVMDEIYLILDIDEIDNAVFDASNHNLSRGFKLMFCGCDGTSKWLRLDQDISLPVKKIFYPKPKASFDRISIRILKRDGTPFNFGTDNALPADVNPDLQNSFTFKITQKITDIEQAIGQRNI